MPRKTTLGIEQTATQTLSWQQIRLGQLLEMDAPELEEAVERELATNPALEDPGDSESRPASAEPPSYWSGYSSNRSADDPSFDPLSIYGRDESEDLRENLHRQLTEFGLSPEVDDFARYLIESLDADGCLRRGLPAVTSEYYVATGIDLTDAEAKEALRAVQHLDPRGLGAADLRESLLLQLLAKPASRTRDDAITVVRDYFESLGNKHYHIITRALQGDRKREKEALALIGSLNPRPGADLRNDSPAAVITPDITLEKDGDIFTLAVNNRHPDLAVATSYNTEAARLESMPRAKRPQGWEVTMKYRNDAREFIRLLTRRQETLLRVTEAIVHLQKEYFETEDVRRMRPMMLKDIAAITGDDITVISRATNNKYLATPWGIFPLRHFFSESMGADGGEFTNRAIEEAITEVVDAEDKRHPLSDRSITEMLQAAGYAISRRTVTKYRERLNIPESRLRKEYQ